MMCSTHDRNAWVRYDRSLFSNPAGQCASRAPSQSLTQECSGVRTGYLGHLFRCSLGHQQTSAYASFGPQIDHVISCLDHFQIVFDHQYTIPALNQLIEHRKKRWNVVEMQSRGRFVENQKCMPASTTVLGQVSDQL